MPPPGGLTTGLAFLPTWLAEAPDAGTLESLLGGWLKASGWRTIGMMWPADSAATFAILVRPEGVGPLPMTPHEIPDIVGALKGGAATVIWQLPNSSGRLYTALQPAGRTDGLIWVERGPGEPWTEADRNYLVLSARLIERSAALAAKIGPILEPSRLQQRLGDFSIIAGRMAHDFDNVLTGIIGFADLSAPLLVPGSQAAKFVGEISKVGQRGIAFTQQLHQFHRSGQTKPQPASFAAALLKEENRLRSAAHRVISDLPAHLAPVGIDAGPLGIVLGHLLDNATEASPPDASIAVTVTVAELSTADAKAYLGRVGPGTHVEVAIRDRGPGIKPDVRAKLFAEPFFTTKVRHRGLGLATVYRILHAHGGGIRIDPVALPETGTVVRIVLPPAAARPAAATHTPRPITPFTVGG